LLFTLVLTKIRRFLQPYNIWQSWGYETSGIDAGQCDNAIFWSMTAFREDGDAQKCVSPKS
jgi:hypothetical protein